MNKLTIIGGADGVGKSSLLGLLCGLCYDLGMIFDDHLLPRGIVRTIDECISMGINFTLESDLSDLTAFRTINTAREKNYFISMYYVGVSSSEESIARIANRVRKGGHDIPSEDVIRRYNNRIDDLFRVMSYCNEVIFYDNENGFVRVGEYHNGKLFDVGNYQPQWYREIKIVFNGKDR